MRSFLMWPIPVTSRVSLRMAGIRLENGAMRIKSKIGRLFASVAAASLLAGGSLALASTPAQAATCKTVQLNSYWWTAIRPRMTVPVCYDGRRVWQNGNVTGLVDTTGYRVDEVSWVGTYGSGGSWMGAGMNYRVSDHWNWVSFGCASRWGINAWGNVVSYNRGC